MPKTMRLAVKRVGNALLGVSLFATAVVGAVLKDPGSPESVQHSVLVDWFLSQTREHGGYILIGLAVLTGAAKVVLWRIGQPWAQESIEAILEEICNLAFNADTTEDPVHYHRVTLFKYKKRKYWIPLAKPRGTSPWGKGRGPQSGWLVPVLRTGHATQKTSTVFLAPDDADNAEGIAGRAWSQRGTAYAPDLPEVSDLTGENNVLRYDNEKPFRNNLCGNG